MSLCFSIRNTINDHIPYVAIYEAAVDLILI